MILPPCAKLSNAVTAVSSAKTADLKLEALESVEGIGPKRAAALIRYYQNIAAIAAAEREPEYGKE